jgi:hypothetical protein
MASMLKIGSPQSALLPPAKSLDVRWPTTKRRRCSRSAEWVQAHLLEMGCH